MTIDTTTLQAFRKDFEQAVKDLEAKYEIKLKLGNISYTSEKFSCKLEAVSIEEGQEGKSVTLIQAEKDWNSYCGLYDLDKEMLGKTIKVKGDPYKILGLMPKRRKFPILVEDKKGNQVLLTVEALKISK